MSAEEVREDATVPEAVEVSILFQTPTFKRQLTTKNVPLTRKNYMGYNETPFERITSMKSIAIAKKIVTTIVGFGTAKIIKDMIENNVDTDTVYQKVTVGSASVAIGYAVSETTSEYTDRKIDEAVALWQKHVTNRKNSAE